MKYMHLSAYKLTVIIRLIGLISLIRPIHFNAHTKTIIK